MGNSASSPQYRPIGGASPAPGPGAPHPSLRTKKKSLELPDLASLSGDNSRGRQAKSASIPIPITPPSPYRHYQQSHHPRAPVHLPSTTDVNLVESFASLPRPNPAAPRGRQQQVTRMQELYNQSQQSTHSPSHQRSFQQEIVRSSIPVALTKALLPTNKSPPAVVQQEYTQKEELLADFVPVKFVWKGGGTQVVLARAGDDEWKGRQPMEKESDNIWTLTVMLRPGTHHVRFLVDGQWRVADDLPAAVDDQGSLANYVAVSFPALSPPPVPPPATVPREKLLPGQSFWSADSSADGEYQHQQQQQTLQHPTHTHSGRWTNVLPPELIEAALEEETYLSASAGHYDVSSSSNTRVTTGFIPAPNIPPAPGLPRHLEKLILNTRVGVGVLGVAGTSSSAAAGVGTRSGSGQARGGVGFMGVGSGQGQAARNRDRDSRDRERDRERERGDRGIRKRATTAAASAAINIPPPPPPSEDGSVPPSSRIPVPETTDIQSTDSTSAPAFANPSTPPQTPTPITPMSPIWSKDLAKSSESGTEVTSPTTTSPTRSPTTLHSSSISTSANNSGTASPNPSTNPTSHFSSPSVSTPPGSRTITIDSSNIPTLSDDGSVLPVPSHVVLHHLSTSAIRNGVLAVGNTIRYRKKYLTTIYYKPT